MGSSSFLGPHPPVRPACLERLGTMMPFKERIVAGKQMHGVLLIPWPTPTCASSMPGAFGHHEAY
eukprot:1151168-Pelagomonas_calceolata.AAC.3